MAEKKKYQINIDDYIGDWGYSKGYVRRKLEEYQGEKVAVRINSLGGSLEHAIVICESFAEHGDVTIDMYGFCASSATICTLKAKKVRISSCGFYLIHKVMNWIDVWGSKNADELAEIIKDLEENKKENEKIDLVLAQMYSEKTGKSISEILPLMKAGGWLTAKEAKDWGFVDEIIPSDEKINMVAMREKLNAFGLPVNTFSKQNLFTNLNNSQPMKNQYRKFNAVIGVERLESSDEGVYLNETQIGAVERKFNSLETNLAKEKGNVTTEKKRASDAETKLNEANKSITRKDNEIRNLKNQITNLKKGAGATTNPAKKSNDGNKGAGAKDNTFEVVKSARELFDSLP